MQTINFVTSNKEKVLLAQTVGRSAGVEIKQVELEIGELQGEDPEAIVKDKAFSAYKLLGRPLVVSDDTWDIPALNGFPGPYMKSINHWFKPEDFIRLMDGIKNKKIILHQYLAYYDGSQMKLFKNDIHGSIIDKPKGVNLRSPNTTVTVLDADDGKTIAEVFELGQAAVVNRYRNRPDAWHSFIEWFVNSAPSAGLH